MTCLHQTILLFMYSSVLHKLELSTFSFFFQFLFLAFFVCSHFLHCSSTHPYIFSAYFSNICSYQSTLCAKSDDLADLPALFSNPPEQSSGTASNYCQHRCMDTLGSTFHQEILCQARALRHPNTLAWSFRQCATCTLLLSLTNTNQ